MNKLHNKVFLCNDGIIKTELFNLRIVLLKSSPYLMIV